MENSNNSSLNNSKITSKRGSGSNCTSRGCGTPSGNDRFIPSRAGFDFENASYRTNVTIKADLEDSQQQQVASSEMSQEFQKTLQSTLNADTNSRILAFKKKPPAPQRGVDDFENPLSVLYSGQNRRNFAANLPSTMPSRQILGNATKVLDAPGLLDDFYINPLDWSCGNQLAIALGTTVYLWNASNGDIVELMNMDGAMDGGVDHISSVKFVQESGTHLAIGSSDKTVTIWDVERRERLRTMRGHASRVSSLSWNKHILTTGGRDSTIFHHDVRAQNHIVQTLKDGHASEVCTVKWADDGLNLATGGNDNIVCLWDVRSGGEFAERPRLRLTQHQAAVKAIAWCPYQRNVLATGGGTSDRTIKIWNAATGNCEQSINTGSQVCSLVFNPNERELLSSHGFSNCELTLWKFPTMAKIKDFNGHTNRVLHTAVSPDGSTVCSAAADESLRFWEIFGLPTAAKKKESSSESNGLKLRIR